MKYTLALLVAAYAVSFSPVQAGSVADLARANCVKAIMAGSAQVTRGEVKNFQFVANGSGWSLSGPDENKHTVECLAAADGHVTWVHNG